jgi:valyl-tRNA synthetase
VLQTTLRLLHPIMPFITEELWGHLRAAGLPLTESIMVAEWPQADASALDDDAETEMALLTDLIRAIRNARAGHDVPPRQRIAAVLAAGDHQSTLVANSDLLTALAGLDPARLHINAVLERKPEQAVALVVGMVECYLPLAGLVDLDAERARLTRELDGVAAQVARLEALLANEGFTGKAPATVVGRERAKLAELQERRTKLQARLDELT